MSVFKNKPVVAYYPDLEDQRLENSSYELRERNQISQNRCIPLKMKEDCIRSRELSVKKAPLGNKQNRQPIDDGVLRMIGSANISRIFQEKSQLIEHQKAEIEDLKQCVFAIKNNKQTRQIEEENAKIKQLAKLRQLEKDYTQNLKQFEFMRDNLKQIKLKYRNAINDKQVVTKKYNTILAENEELTQLINSLKGELQTTTRTQSSWALEEEMAHLREDIREAQVQKLANEERAGNFQRRMNQYKVKYCEIQDNFSQVQIRCYKLEQENENLKVDKDQLERKVGTLSNQLTAQREIHREEMEKLRERTKREQSCWRSSEELIELQGLVEKLKEEGRKLTDANESNSLKLHEQRERRVKLQNRCSELTNEKGSSKQHYEQMMAQLQIKLIEKQRQIEQKKVQQEQIVGKINRLEMQIQEGKDFLSEENKTLHSENRSLTGILTLHQQEIKDLQEQKQSISYENHELSQKIEQLSQKIQFLEENYSKYNPDLQQKLQEITYYRQKYEYQLQKVNQMSGQFKQLEQQNCNLTKRNAANVVEIGSLKAEVVVLRKEMENMLEEEEEQNEEVRELRGCLSQRRFDLENAHQLIKNMEEKIAELQVKLNEVESRWQNSEQNSRSTELQLKQKNDQNIALRGQFEQIRKVMAAQSAHSQQTIHSMQTSLTTAKKEIQHSTEVIREKEQVIAKIKNELQVHMTDIKMLTRIVSQSQHKYSQLSQQHFKEMKQFESLKYKMQQMARSNENRHRELEQSSISACVELDSSQAAVDILRKENEELQKIFGVEIERRNATIKELVREKKQLFDQLVARQGL